VGVPEDHGTGAVEHRVLPPEEATAELHLSVGADIENWVDQPGAVRVATADLRTAADRRRYQELRQAVVAELEATGHPELVPTVDGALMAVAISPDVSQDVREQIAEMADIGQPAAVFVLPR
jgi:hypothetical protein